MKSLLRNQLFWAGAVLVVLFALILANNDSATISFTNGRLTGPLIDTLIQLPPILMIALGMTLVIATSGIDLSVGSVMAVAGAVAMQMLKQAENPDGGLTVTTAILAALLVGFACGAFSGFLVSVVKLQPFITTLIMMMAGRGIANIVTGGKNAAGESTTFNWISQGRIFGFPTGPILAFLILALVVIVVRKTALGLNIEAVGINPRAAEMAGVRSSNVLFMVYAISGLLAAVAGIFAVSYVGVVEVSSNGTGSGMEMDAILAVVIGGTSLAGGKFNFGGTVLGAFVITALNQVVVYLGVSSAAVPAFKALVIIFICVLQAPNVHGWFSRPGQTSKKETQGKKREEVVVA